MFHSFCRKALALSVLSCAMLLPVEAAAAENVQKENVKEEKTESCGSRFGKKMLWYIPDRCMDLFDCFTVEFGFGFNLRANLMLTRWAPIGAGAGPTVMIGWNGSRDGGIYMLKGANADCSVLHAACQDQSWIMGNYADLKDCGKDAPLYVQQYRDPLTFGFEGGCIGNGKMMVHLSSIADFICGIFLIDFEKDDYVNR